MIMAPDPNPTDPPLSKRQPAPNRLCPKCLRHCKQAEAALLLDCPRYLARPFKSPDYAFDQLDLFGSDTAAG